ncbi:DUF4241 domain-containing protein [Cellulomonas denverensis]|uniref:DUF4241 domain-containing protein n=1 Tax=Cellulomonas denverensis TaxID=264297 RepID=UPI0035E8DBC4
MEQTPLLALRTGRIEGWKYTHHVVDLGTLRLPSGRLEASDPFVALGEGMVVRVPPGEYPVRVTVVDVSDAQDGSHLREAWLSVILADGEPATTPRLTPDGVTPEPGLVYGVGVDAGTVAFADQEAVGRCMPPPMTWYDEVYDTGRPDSWFALMDSAEHLGPGLANITMPHATASENVVLSHSGWGDGFFPVVGGYDTDGRLLSVHIDLLVEDPEDDRPSA